MTAKEHCSQLDDIHGLSQDVIDSHIEFAKYHVQKALEAASERATMRCDEYDYRGNIVTCVEPRTGLHEYQGYEGYDEDEIKVIIEKDSILNSYSLENIK
jgi:hypothetical protein